MAFGTDNTIYYNEGFRRVLEDHMNYLRTHSKTRSIDVDAGLAYRFEYDFYGLLNNYNISHHLHWIILRMLDKTSPMDIDRNLTSFLLPDQSELDVIRSNHMTTNKIS